MIRTILWVAVVGAAATLVTDGWLQVSFVYALASTLTLIALILTTALAASIRKRLNRSVELRELS